MKFVTIICLLVAAPEWIKSENSPQNTNHAENETEGKISYTGSQIWRTYGLSRETIGILEELENDNDISIWGRSHTSIDILIKADLLRKIKQKLAENNIKYEVKVEDMQKIFDLENPAEIDHDARKRHKLTWKAYHRLDAIYEYLDYLAKTYPELCTVQTIGHSFEKRPIRLLKISNGNTKNEAIWIDGGIHAREWISPATVTFIINQFATNFSSQPTAVQNIDWYFAPVLNPDGYEFSHTKNRLWRKNRRTDTPGGKCIGVDLNRNFGYKWGGKYAETNPCAPTYQGSGPFSEPESAAVKNFFQKSKATWKAFISFHAYGQYILYPYGYDEVLPSDSAHLHEVGERMASAIKSVVGKSYTVGPVAVLPSGIPNLKYYAPGGTMDWAKGSLNIKYSYTVELRPQIKRGEREQFVLSASEIEPTGVENLAALTVVAAA